MGIFFPYVSYNLRAGCNFPYVKPARRLVSLCLALERLHAFYMRFTRALRAFYNAFYMRLHAFCTRFARVLLGFYTRFTRTCGCRGRRSTEHRGNDLVGPPVRLSGEWRGVRRHLQLLLQIFHECLIRSWRKAQAAMPLHQNVYETFSSTSKVHILF